MLIGLYFRFSATPLRPVNGRAHRRLSKPDRATTSGRRGFAIASPTLSLSQRGVCIDHPSRSPRSGQGRQSFRRIADNILEIALPDFVGPVRIDNQRATDRDHVEITSLHHLKQVAYVCR